MKRADRRDRTYRKYISRVKKKFCSGYYGHFLHYGIKNRDWRKPVEDEETCRDKNTPRPCSCYMCGNRRKWNGMTKAERKNIIAFDEMIEELGG